jgi:hypothetical protein
MESSGNTCRRNLTYAVLNDMLEEILVLLERPQAAGANIYTSTSKPAKQRWESAHLKV